MIDSQKLLTALQRQVDALLSDLEQRAQEDGPVRECVKAEYAAAVQAERTALSEAQWRKELLVQGAVAWVLSCVFVRFMEDNGLTDEIWLSGVGAQRDVARGQRQRHFSEQPHDTDREVLHRAFRAAARFPAVAGLFDERHNPLWRMPISGDAARDLIALWDALDDAADDVRPLFDFTDPARDTRFLGDLYQDLSEDAKKRYALLQTPIFVESFILDRTLTPALAEFGLPVVKLIDPTCGSGHFLIGAFERLFAAWQDREPSVPAPELAQRALRAVHGVDLNPFAVAIARFRLIVTALNACGTKRLADAPGWELRLACGDSLLHGPREGQLSGFGSAIAIRGLEHHFMTEDAGLVEEILTPGYHVVVGNPPYIVARDKALNAAYRERYMTCHRKYSLAVPFMERFFELARLPDGEAGYVGKITADSFMKREFGTKLVETFLPTVDLQVVINSSIAHIPGHDNLPTAILIGRSRAPVLGTIRVVQGIHSERGTPPNPAAAPAWLAIIGQVDLPGSESRYVSVVDVDRSLLARHPWSLQGGGAGDLRARLEADRPKLESVISEPIGFGAISAADDVFLRPGHAARKTAVPSDLLREVVEGDRVRDWLFQPGTVGCFPYRGELVAEEELSVEPTIWAYRTLLWSRPTFTRETYRQAGRTWWEWHQVSLSRCNSALSIAYAFNATHNHFVLDRGGKVFNRTAPVITLARSSTEQDYFGLLGVLNSATACFWLHQVCQPKPGFEEPWDRRFEHDGGKVGKLPLPDSRPARLASQIEGWLADRSAILGNVDALLRDGRAAFERAEQRDAELLAQAISAQEESDWHVMAAYGLVSADFLTSSEAAPPLRVGERAFEIGLGRAIADGRERTTWFEKLGATPTVNFPGHWPSGYREVVERRVALIDGDRSVGLIERQECKRRWAEASWSDRESDALRTWLLDFLEAMPIWSGNDLVTCAGLSDAARHDPRVILAAQRIARSIDVDVAEVIAGLVVSEGVPYLAARRYSETGLARRGAWDHVWALQRQEDAIDRLGLRDDVARRRKAEEVGVVPLPPEYKKEDFRKLDYWRLRGKLDVPRERFVLVPDGSRTGDPSPVVGWAGWDHATFAFALANRASLLRTQDGAGEERLVPLLAGIVELLPWVAQWHPEPDVETGELAVRELEDFVADELGRIGCTRDDLLAWRPEAPARGRRAT